jgi:hypothetical protein
MTTMLNEGFFDDGFDGNELMAFWKELGCPVVPPEFVDVPLDEMAEKAISSVRDVLNASRLLLGQTIVTCALIKQAQDREEPVTLRDQVTAAACGVAVQDSELMPTVEALIPKLEELSTRIQDPELTLLKFGKLVQDFLALNSQLEHVMRWHENLKRSLSQGVAQLN